MFHDQWSHVGSLKAVIAEKFKPQKLAEATNQVFSLSSPTPQEPVAEHLPTSLSGCFTRNWACLNRNPSALLPLSAPLPASLWFVDRIWTQSKTPRGVCDPAFPSCLNVRSFLKLYTLCLSYLSHFISHNFYWRSLRLVPGHVFSSLVTLSWVICNSCLIPAFNPFSSPPSAHQTRYHQLTFLRCILDFIIFLFKSVSDSWSPNTFMLYSLAYKEVHCISTTYLSIWFLWLLCFFLFFFSWCSWILKWHTWHFKQKYL